jgi:hypothetical protein
MLASLQLRNENQKNLFFFTIFLIPRHNQASTCTIVKKEKSLRAQRRMKRSTLEVGAEGGVEAEVSKGAGREEPLLRILFLRFLHRRRRLRRRLAELPLGGHGKLAAGETSRGLGRAERRQEEAGFVFRQRLRNLLNRG